MTRKSPDGRRTTSKKNTTKKVQATRGGTSGRSSSASRRTSSSKRTSSKRSNSSTRRPKRNLLPKFNFSLDLQQKALVVGIILIFTTGILVLSLISPNRGILPMTLERWLRTLFGWGGILVPLFMAGTGIYLVLWGMDQPPRFSGWRVTGAVLLFLVFSTFASLIVVNQSEGVLDYMAVARNQQGGGYLGGVLAGLSVQAFDTIGTVFILLILGLLGAILVSGVSRTDFGAFITAAWQGLRERPVREAVPEQRPLPLGNARREPVRPNRPVRDLPRNEPPPPPDDDIPFEVDQEPPAAETAAPAAAATRNGSRGRRNTAAQPAEPEIAATPPTDLDEPEGQLQREPNWQLPVLAEVLESGSDQEISNDSIREQVEVIEHTLESFGAPAIVVDINQGPTVTQFGVEPQFLEMRGGKRTKVKVGKIASLADDLALALAAHSVRVQAPVPGKGYVGIEVPNTATALVSLRDLMESGDYQKIKSPVRIGLGQNVAGQPVCTDLSKMPHLLVAGTTGSGKSVCVNAIIARLLLENTPEELKFV
ncbi:MAG: DNA translocase FtsK 4TM domain-containing protein, partial [Anaerolineales bacterium]|nr:DNA translocase FtsK 4TM domain-containing protein [Anaerolineales bacterium]